MSFYSLRLSAAIDAYLEQMIDTGLWGEDSSEVIRALTMEGIRKAVAEGFITVPSSDEETLYDPPSPPDPAPEPRATYKCEICEDGLNIVAPHDGAGNCAACGQLLETPF